jgi:hypothetical protein
MTSPDSTLRGSASPGVSKDAPGIKEPKWSPAGLGIVAALVTRAQYRRAIKAAKREGGREALLSAAEACRDLAKSVRAAAEWDAGIDADHWTEVALWLEARAGR